MYRRPSTSVTYAPCPLATKYGVPPTERKARTGEFTPPGMTREARSKSSSFVTAPSWGCAPDPSALARSPRELRSREHVGELGGEVGEDDVGAGALDRGDMLEGDGIAFDPAAL